MADIFEKADDNTLRRTTTETKAFHYDYKFLLDQKSRLEIALQETNNLIAQAEALGIKLKVIGVDPVI